MKLFEFEAKNIFKENSISVPKSILIDNESEIEEACENCGFPCVIKAQVLYGGRGRKGLVKKVSSLSEAREKSHDIFKVIPSYNKILVEKAIAIKKELYLSITLDPVAACALLIASSEGGIEIETIARKYPEKIVKEKIYLSEGIFPYQVRNVLFELGLGGELFKDGYKLIMGLYKIFREYDAELVEINPIFLTENGSIIVGDAKVSIDDNSLYRQNRFQKTRDRFESDTEYRAACEGIPYLQFDGDISLMCAGAGLTTTVYDLINDCGGTVASYLEFGGPNYSKAFSAMELTLENSSKVILIVTFGTIARADVMAQGVVDAQEKLKPDRPIVTCIRGTGEEKAMEILKEAGLEPILDTEIAVKRAVDIAHGRIQ